MVNTEQAKADALAFLRENTTAVIATSFNDEPRASTVYYYVDNDFNFYFITKQNTGKYINIQMNPRAAVVVGTGPEHITVQATGLVELINDETKKQEIIDELTNIREREHVKIVPIEEIPKFEGRHQIVFKIHSKQVMFMNLDSSRFPHSITEDYMVVYSQ